MTHCPGSGHYMTGVGGYFAVQLGPSAYCPHCGKFCKLTKKSLIRKHKRITNVNRRLP